MKGKTEIEIILPEVEKDQTQEEEEVEEKVLEKNVIIQTEDL